MIWYIENITSYINPNISSPRDDMSLGLIQAVIWKSAHYILFIIYWHF